MKNTIYTLLIAFSLFTACQSTKSLTTTTTQTASISEKLLAGNQRFISEKAIHPDQSKKTVLSIQNGQKPFAVVVTCSDSRVSPEILFDQGLGDLFVVRNAGNLISNLDMGTIEYAVEHLGVKNIVVMGHTECGAIKAYLADKDLNYKKHLSHIDDIVEVIATEKEENDAVMDGDPSQKLLYAIDANIKHSAKLISENEIVKSHNVEIVTMRYDIHTGLVNKL